MRFSRQPIKIVFILLIFSVHLIKSVFVYGYTQRSSVYYKQTIIDTRSLLERLASARPLIVPNSSISTPVAYGIGWGTIVIGISGQNGTQFTGQPFGEYALGFGLGNPAHYGALTTIATFGGLDEVIRDGNLNFQLSHDFTAKNAAIAIGIENIAPWGADKRNQRNEYVVASKIFTLIFKREYYANIVFSTGLGNSRFVHNYETHTNEVNQIRPFASLGMQLFPQIMIMIDYVGLTYNAGISVVPFLNLALVASLTVTDLTNRGGSHIPIAASIGYAYTF